jgi:hypothetical protein
VQRQIKTVPERHPANPEPERDFGEGEHEALSGTPENSSTVSHSKARWGGHYEIVVKLDSFIPGAKSGVHTLFRNNTLCHLKRIQARNRADAVKKAVNWYWLTYRGSQPAHHVLQVDDPYDEVQFTPDFRCHDPKHKYLPDQVIERLILESQGKLERDKKIYTPGKPPASVRWKKKRGKMEESNSNSRTGRRRRPPPLKRVAPSIYEDGMGNLWYCIVTQRQRIANPFQRGKQRRRLLAKRKKKLIRLEAQSLAQAAREINHRKLLDLNLSGRKQRQFQKLLGYIEHLHYV